MLLNNDYDDFINKKLYINHKTRRKPGKSLKVSSQKSKHYFPIFKQKPQLDVTRRNRYAKSLKLFRLKFLSNNIANSQQKLQQRLSLTNNNYETFHNNSNNIIHFNFSHRKQNKNSKFCLNKAYNANSGYSLANFRGTQKASTAATSTNDLKQRLALRKRYLRRKRKRKFHLPQTKRKLSCHQHQQLQLQQLADSRQQPAPRISSLARSKSYVDLTAASTVKTTTFLHRVTETSPSHQQFYAENHHNHYQSPEKFNFRRNLSYPPQRLSNISNTNNTSSHLSSKDTNRNSVTNNTAAIITSTIMWKVLIVSIIHSSLTTIATLYSQAKTTLSQTAQLVVRAVIAATTLPIIIQRIQQKQVDPPNPYQIREEEQQSETDKKQWLHPHRKLEPERQRRQDQGEIQTDLELLLPQQPQHQMQQHLLPSQPAAEQHTQLHTQQHHQLQQQVVSCNASKCSNIISSSLSKLLQRCHRRCRFKLLPLTTKGLNKHSWIFLLIYLNLSAKGK